MNLLNHFKSEFVRAAMMLLLTVMAFPTEAWAEDSGPCGKSNENGGNNVTWTYNSETKTLTISGTGAMADFEMANVPWHVQNINKVIIEDGVTSIGSYAFAGCNIESITIPSSVTSLGEGCFSSCYELTEITIPASVTSLDIGCFSSCHALTKITIPASVTSIGKGAFSSCESLETITVESGNTTYDSRDNCNAIIEISSNTLIAGCKKTDIPTTVKHIGSNAFYYSSNLTLITIPSSVESIGLAAFRGCSSLNTVYVMPSTAPRLGRLVFDGLPSTCNIYVNGADYKNENWSSINKTFISTVTATDVTATTTETPVINYDNKDYYAQGTEFTLSYSGTLTTGYIPVYTAKKTSSGEDVTSAVINGSTLTLPDYDVSITATTTDVWGVSATPNADGSSTKPYVITTTEGLDLLAKMVNGTDGFSANNFSGKYFVLGNDITYSYEGLGDTESNYTAIGGRYNNTFCEFCGNFNGQGHTVKGIRIISNIHDSPCQGLFGRIGTRGSVSHVTVSDACLTCNGSMTGSIVGYDSNGIIFDCHVTADVSITGSIYCGGIVGYQEKTGDKNVIVQGCTSAANIINSNSESTCFGGIVGYNTQSTTIQDCLYFGGQVGGTYNVGAIVGYFSNGTIKNCYYTDENFTGKDNSGNDITLSNGNPSVGYNDDENATITKVGLARTITLGEGVGIGGKATDYCPASSYSSNTRITAYAPADNEPGFALKLETVSGSTTTTTYYSTAGANVTLSYSGSVPEGSSVVYTAKNSSGEDVTSAVINGSTLTMPKYDVNVSATIMKGDGSTGNPFKISTYAQLKGFAAAVNGGQTGACAELENDIVCKNDPSDTKYPKDWIPIGDENHKYSGTFNGKDKTIEGLSNVNVATIPDYAGLFGYMNGGTVKNVILENAIITGTKYIGGIAGYKNGGSVEYAIVRNSDIAGPDDKSKKYDKCYLGGIVGENYSGIVQYSCVMNSSVIIINPKVPLLFEGGIAGRNSSTSSTIQNCYATVHINATIFGDIYTQNSCGGIAGDNCGTIQNCHYSGENTILFSSMDGEAGGITGANTDIVKKCYYNGTGDFFGDSKYIGGIIGRNGGTADNCYFLEGNPEVMSAIGDGSAGTNTNVNSLSAEYFKDKSKFYGFDFDSENADWLMGYYAPLLKGISYNIRFFRNFGNIIWFDRLFNTVGDGQKVDLPNDAFSRDGFKIKCWNTKADGSGDEIALEADARLVGPVTLYAQWECAQHNYENGYCTYCHATEPWSGTGTSNDPYVINYPSQLDLLAANVNAGTSYGPDDTHTDGYFFALGNDITYSHTTAWNDENSTENNYTAIGTGNGEFNGTFDGRNHTISGIRIYKSGNQGEYYLQGLFGFTDGGTVRNVVLSNARITGDDYVGGIAGWFYGGRIENCHVAATVAVCNIISSNYHGGIAGKIKNKGTITGCTSAATIASSASKNECGIIVGENNGSELIGNFAMGGKINNSNNSGAICGYKDSGKFTNNYYKNCTVNDKTSNIGIGFDIGSGKKGDIAGAMPAIMIYHDADVKVTGDALTLTIPKHKDLKANSTTEYETVAAQTFCMGEKGKTVTLAFTGTVPTGSNVVYTAKNSSGEDVTSAVINGSTLTIPDYDVSITATRTDVWGVLPPTNADGSKDNPYIITTTEGLNLLAKMVNGTDGYNYTSFEGKYFKLGNDIDFKGKTDFVPIGYDNLHFFESHFDGYGKTISNLVMTDVDKENVGLFGYNTGEIKNLTLSGCTISGGNSSIQNYIGTLVGRNNGSISECTVKNCTVSCKANSKYPFVGGITGYTSKAITNCVVENTNVNAVTSDDSGHYALAGGIAGFLSSGTVSGCEVKGTTTVTADYSNASANVYAGAMFGDINAGTTISGNTYESTVVTKTKQKGETDYTVKSGQTERGIGAENDVIGQVELAGTKKVKVLVPNLVGNGGCNAVEGTYYMFVSPNYYILPNTTFKYSMTPTNGYKPRFTLSDNTINVAVTKKTENGVYKSTEFSFTMPDDDVTATLTFPIDLEAISDDNFSIDNGNYTGDAVEPTTVKVTGVPGATGVTVLTKGTHFTIKGYKLDGQSVTSPVKIGIYTVTIEGMGDFIGTKDVSYRITKTSLDNAIIEVPTQTYTGSEVKPAITVRLTAGGDPLVKDNDYSVAYSNNINAASEDATVAPTVTITGEGKYTGSKSVTFTIKPKALTDEMVTLDPEKSKYNGSYQKPKVYVVDGDLLTTDDYTVKNDGGEDVGTYEVVVTAKRNYTGEVTKIFEITEDFAFNNPFTGADQIWATYYNDRNYNITPPEGIEAYIVTAVSETNVSIKAWGYLPKGATMLLKKTGTTIGDKFTIYMGETEDFSDNKLNHAYHAISTNGRQYVLYNNEFVKATETIPDGKNYLELENPNSARVLLIGGEATGIENVQSSIFNVLSDQWYDLQGRRIEKPTKAGLYIRRSADSRTQGKKSIVVMK